MSKWRTIINGCRESNVYHTNKECRAIGSNIEEVTDSEIEAHGLTECQFCQDGDLTTKKDSDLHRLHAKLSRASPDDLDEL